MLSQTHESSSVAFADKHHFYHDSRVLRTGSVFQSLLGYESHVIILGESKESFAYEGNEVTVIALPKALQQGAVKCLGMTILQESYGEIQKTSLRWYFEARNTKNINNSFSRHLVANDFETLWFAVAFKSTMSLTSLFYDSHDFGPKKAYYAKGINKIAFRS